MLSVVSVALACFRMRWMSQEVNKLQRGYIEIVTPSVSSFENHSIQIEFRVRALGTPKPSIQWYKDDLEIFSCDRIEMREEEDGGAVVLKGAR